VDREIAGRILNRGPTDPSIFGTARSFPTALGSRIRPGEIGGYFFDFRFKAEAPGWPPPDLEPSGQRLHVVTAQWALGCYERYLAGEGEEWLAAAIAAGDDLVGDQVRGGERDGAWLHGSDAMPHSYVLPSPWTSAMAQGEGASLLVRLYKETEDERYGEAARRALKPFGVSVRRGGVRASLGDGPFFEEYPTLPPSLVLNGAIFALWGLYDVGVGLGDAEATAEFDDGVRTLAENLGRWDTGRWSRYDLFPHPIPNVASSAYHALHIAQLRAMQLIAPDPRFEEAADRFEAYAESRLNVARAFALKSFFRLLVPRNPMLAHRLPWSESRRRAPGKRRLGSPLVLCYHALSHDWSADLATSPERFREQLEFLLRRGYRGATFAEIADGTAPAKAVAVTFDDGYRSVFEHARPILSELGLPATVFVATDFVGGQQPMSWPGIDRWLGTPHEREMVPMSWEQLHGLVEEGWEVGSHTRSHPRLTQLDDQSLSGELAASRERCTEGMGRPCRTLAYPYGDHDDRVCRAAHDAGYEAAAVLRLGKRETFSWPRVGVYNIDDARRFRLKVSPLLRGLRSSPLGRLLERARPSAESD